MKWRVTAPDGTQLSIEAASQADAIALGKRQHAQALPPVAEPKPAALPVAPPPTATPSQPVPQEGFLEAGPPMPFWQRAKAFVGKHAGPIPELLTPGSWTEAGIEAALGASPFVGRALGVALPSVVAEAPALARWLTRGARVGLAAAGGAVGGAVGGEGVGRGALTGAKTAATGELLATPLQWISRSAAGPMMQRLDAKRLSRALSEIAPDLPRVTSPAELHKLVMGTAGGELLGQALERDLRPVLRATKGVAFRFPALEEALNKPFWPTTFEGALEELRKIGYRGYSMTGDPRGAITAIAARQLRHELRQQMTDALRNPAKYAAPIVGTPSFRGIRGPKVAQAFDDAMQRYARGREAVDLLADSRVWEGGRLNMRALQELAGTEEYRSVSGTLKDDAARLYEAIYRGGTALGRDVPGAVGVHVRLYPRAGIPHAGVSMPRFPSYTGQAPGVTRKGASFAPATSLAALGLFGGPTEPDEQPPPAIRGRAR